MDFKENQEFEKFFIMFLNDIKEIDDKNKYCQKYLENQKNLKYNKLSKFISDIFKDKDILTFEDFKSFIDCEDNKDIIIIPGFTIGYIKSLKHDDSNYQYIVNLYELVGVSIIDNYKIEKSEVSINEVEKTIEEKEEEINKEIDKNKNKKADNMMDAVLNMIDTTGLNEKIQNLTDDDLNKMSEQVNKILGGNESSKLIGDMVQTIGKELKSQDLTNGNLTEQIKTIADKVSDTYANGEKQASEKEMEELYNSTQNFVNNFKSPEDLNVNNINKMLKQYGINQQISQNDLNMAYKQLGITPQQLANPNRKMKRKAQQMKKKNIKK